MNKILRKIWHLPPRSHTGIVHCVARVSTISNLLYHRFQSFLSRAISSSSSLIRNIFHESSHYVYSFAGYNVLYGHQHVRVFSDVDFDTACTIRLIRSYYHGLYIPIDSVNETLSCQ